MVGIGKMYPCDYLYDNCYYRYLLDNKMDMGLELLKICQMLRYRLIEKV